MLTNVTLMESYCKVLPLQTHIALFLLWNIKGNVQQNINAALYFTMKVDGDHRLSSFKNDK